eukprot:CAMPEP_0115014412 /NCGR_PEP_ID=MMETSP0216-20121206/26062_1 /TAXON_ID=223996 /ORGANISM="Protocruzia adherens, Strain Boccale" /LENGTH=267 /DNA_ID=CAMNT_0002384145 /DNA_START=49 /DNA_END=852 /DNA_ORIENTATION=+
MEPEQRNTTHVKNSASVSEYAYFEDVNYLYRSAMEDAYIVRDGYAGNKNDGFFSVFDGHGGIAAVDYAKVRIHELLRDEITRNYSHVEQGFCKAFEQVNDELKSKSCENTGTTACCCLIRQEAGVKVIYTANVGDTRAVVCNNGKADRLSYDHKACDPSEVERVRSGGGFVFGDRLAGQLAITRALGDLALLNDGLLCRPYFSKRVLGTQDKYLIIATDGVWDVLSDQEAVDLTKDMNDSYQMAQHLVERALARGSSDNTSCLIVKF